MKIHIVKPTYHFEFIEKIFYNSFKDLGHTFTELENADIVIGILTVGREDLKITKDQKFVFVQTEPYKISPHYKDALIQFGPYPFSRYNADAYWGFEENDGYEKYLIIGYHPSFDFTSKGFVTPTQQLGFIGCITDRRHKVFSNSKFKVSSCSTWDIEKGIYLSKHCKINIYMNAWDNGGSRIPWDRIARYLPNKCFFIMADIGNCPIKQIVRFDLKDYEATIEKYINNDKLRQDIAEECYTIYKRDFDMRNILQKKIEDLCHP